MILYPLLKAVAKMLHTELVYVDMIGVTAKVVTKVSLEHRELVHVNGQCTGGRRGCSVRDSCSQVTVKEKYSQADYSVP